MEKDFEQILENIDLNAPAPTEEPMRQYYYMKQLKEYVRNKSEELGRPLQACNKVFGCQMNLELMTA